MRITRRPHLALLSFGLALTLPAESQGYELYRKKTRVHETMTELSAACFADAQRAGTSVTDCARHLRIARDVEQEKDSTKIDGIRVGEAPLTYGDLKLAVRWPDDPQRKLRGHAGLRSMTNFAMAFRIFRYCRHYDGMDVGVAGLLCASHYGDMQFLHAMASTKAEPTTTTRAKALAWAKFAYDYAKGDLADDADLCSALAAYPEIRSAVGGSEDGMICKGDRRGRDPRTVGQHFGFKCLKMLSSATCYVVCSVAERRRAALGAILHLVQDSYSQGHVQRGKCGEPSAKPAATIRLAPVERFLDYGQQNSKAHTASDQWPVTDASDSRVDHPVVAGARVLEMLAKNQKSDALVEYLGSRVLLLADSHHGAAGEGECYKKQQRR